MGRAPPHGGQETGGASRPPVLPPRAHASLEDALEGDLGLKPTASATVARDADGFLRDRPGGAGRTLAEILLVLA
jgi:hypothetical protein